MIWTDSIQPRLENIVLGEINDYFSGTLEERNRSLAGHQNMFALKANGIAQSCLATLMPCIQSQLSTKLVPMTNSLGLHLPNFSFMRTLTSTM